MTEWIEACFPDCFLDGLSQSIIDRLESIDTQQFHRGKDQNEFHIQIESWELFCTLVSPHKPYIVQRYLVKDIPLEERQNMALDMINALKRAGVQGISNFVEKIGPTIR